MRKLLLIGIILASFLSYTPPILATCAGQSTTPIPYASETIVVSSTALPFTSSVYNPAGNIGSARLAEVTVDTDSIRYWKDGTVPTNLLGHIIYATAGTSGVFEVCGNTAIRNFRMIRVTTDASVKITYSH